MTMKPTPKNEQDVPLAERLRAFLTRTRLEAAGIKNLDPNNRQSQLLHDILVWQEIKAIATSAHDVAWKQARENEFIPADEALREAGAATPGVSRTIKSVGRYAMIATVSNPAYRFNIEEFIVSLVKKFKMRTATLLTMVEAAKIPSTASLSKKVIQL